MTTLNYTSGLLSSVVGPFGHTLTISYNPGQLISQITDPAGHAITYTYDGNNNLIGVQYQDSTTRTYQYSNSSAPNNLTSITDGHGQVFLSVTYDGDGRAISSQHAGGADAGTVSYGATTVGLTPMRVNRILEVLRESSIVSVRGRVVSIGNLDKLTRLAYPLLDAFERGTAEYVGDQMRTESDDSAIDPTPKT